MEMLWFWLTSVLVAIYVVMDGFDFGAGILHLFVAQTNEERREVLGAVGPFWDGNEVWLLAGGGTMFLAFPRVLGAGFSGFYLPLFLVLWFLLLRAISIAGGFTNMARKGEVTIRRKVKEGTRAATVSVESIIDNRIPDPPLQAGDSIYVPQRAF